MKSNLMLRKFKTSNVPGTTNMIEEKSFFGSKMLEIEDEIIVDNNTIQYSQYFTSSDRNLVKQNGFQYFDFETHSSDETVFTLNLNNLKDDSQNIRQSQQDTKLRETNTIWKINIDTRNILREYLFAKIKERRVFKSVKYNDLLNKDINQSIYYYIDKNILDRYKYYKTEFYLQYINIEDKQQISTSSILKYDPKYDFEAKQKGDLIPNLNIVKKIPTNSIGDLFITYNQTESSKEYKFNYYYDVFYQKI